MLKDDYSRFLASKKIEVQSSGFDVDESTLNGNLKDFQKYGLTVALKKGKFSFFFDCGNIKNVITSTLTAKKNGTMSCGCYHSSVVSNGRYAAKHNVKVFGDSSR